MSLARVFICSLGLTGFSLAETTPIIPPTYVCQKTPTPPIIDGKLDDNVWKNARLLQEFQDIEGTIRPKPNQATNVKMAWDDQNLYIAAELEEKNIWALLKERDSVIYYDPDFEVFIDPESSGKNYIELEINALNTVWDLFLTHPYRNDKGIPLHDWDIKKLKTAVHLNGTLNNSADEDKSWSVEIAIPWESITGHKHQPRRGTPPKNGDVMRMNFSRVNWQIEPDTSSPSSYKKKIDPKTGKNFPESNHVWAPTGKINIHMPEFWGQVKFSDKPVGTWESLAVDKDELLRLELFNFYRKQLDFFEKKGHFSDSISEVIGEKNWNLRGENLSKIAHFSHANKTLWTLILKSPWTGRTWQINHDGEISNSPIPQKQIPEVYLWIHGKDQPNNTKLWEKRFANYKSSGIDTVIIDDSLENVTKLTSIAHKHGLKCIAWVWTMNRPEQKDALANPNWYAVSRSGKSCHTPETRPFVAYYQFLCPNNPGVQKYLTEIVSSYAKIPQISGIQLDYIRMPDVILPRGLWEKYKLVMDKELPDFDFCYCPLCQAKFEKKYGRKIAQDPTQDKEWRQFRLDSIANMVDLLTQEGHRQRKEMSAAVFPTPQLAQKMVRQSWDKFSVDYVFSMTYHTFYRERETWIAEKIKEANEQIENRFPINPGFFLPDINGEKTLTRQLTNAYEAGARGFGIFSHEHFDAKFQKELRAWKERYQK